MTDRREALRNLPSVDKLLAEPGAVSLVARYGRPRLVATLRHLLATARAALLAGTTPPTDDWLNRAAHALEEQERSRMTRVLNLTGVVVHTNLGRSLMAEVAAKAAYDAAMSNVNLEYRLGDGVRGDRDELVAPLITELTGAEAATVVNNNAAAVLLTLNTLAEGRPVAVSRGELVEIGGSFRLPEIIAKSGVTLMEIGTTNRTHLADYEEAIDNGAALILRAHTSNYRIVGFTTQPTHAELSALASKRGLPYVVDLGSGAILPPPGATGDDEPTIGQTLIDGADLVTVSGDKLLGGPQCGVIAGKKTLVEMMKKNHLKRALRCDKMTLAALEATLRLYRDPVAALAQIPTLSHLARPVEAIRAVAEEVAASLREHFGESATVTVIDDVARAGSGSLPEIDLPSVSVAIDHKEMSADALAAWFRSLPTPVIGRIEKGLFRLDMRTLESGDRLTGALV